MGATYPPLIKLIGVVTLGLAICQLAFAMQKEGVYQNLSSSFEFKVSEETDIVLLPDKPDRKIVYFPSEKYEQRLSLADVVSCITNKQKIGSKYGSEQLELEPAKSEVEKKKKMGRYSQLFRVSGIEKKWWHWFFRNKGKRFEIKTEVFKAEKQDQPYHILRVYFYSQSITGKIDNFTDEDILYTLDLEYDPAPEISERDVAVRVLVIKPNLKESQTKRFKELRFIWEGVQLDSFVPAKEECMEGVSEEADEMRIITGINQAALIKLAGIIESMKPEQSISEVVMASYLFGKSNARKKQLRPAFRQVRALTGAVLRFKDFM